jgi:nicotinamidase-related amidase
LDVDRAMVLVVDIQAKLLPLIRGQADVVARAAQLLRGTRIFQLPVVVTEQYPKGLGHTDPAGRDAASASEAQFFEKAAFSVWAEDGVREALLRLDRPQAIVTGIETHVCVQQTALDLKSRDYDVFVCADAVGSRTKVDHRTGLDRMRRAGVFVTTVESVLFELCERCDTPSFKAMIGIIKSSDEAAKRRSGDGGS